MLRRLTAMPVRLLVAIALLAALLPGVAMPSTVVAGDFTNASGRLIVIWRTDAPRSLSVGGVARSERSVDRRRSLVVAAAGQTDAVIARLRTDPRIAAILPDVLMSVAGWPATGAPNDALYAASQADLPLIGVPTAWQTTIGNPSVIVAVLDTGMTRTHVDLDGVVRRESAQRDHQHDRRDRRPRSRDPCHRHDRGRDEQRDRRCRDRPGRLDHADQGPRRRRLRVVRATSWTGSTSLGSTARTSSA